jgi:tetratricopeptide (TPR) repeat protein
MKMTKKAITLGLGLVVMGSASFAQSLNDAKKAIDAEQYQKATSMLKALVNSQASKGENYYSLGEVYLRTDYVDSARAVFTKGIAADPKFSLNYIGLGEADLATNNAASAKTNFDKAVEVASKKDYLPSLYIGKAYVAAPKPDFTSALPYLQKADELDPNDKDPETFLALGDFYAVQKKNSEALQNYMRALNINENLLRATVQIGRMYKESRAFPESEERLKEAIAKDPNYGPAYREIAELYMQWANFEPANFDAKAKLALENYRKYLDLTDKSFESKLRYAQFLFYAKDYKTLEQVTAELASVSPNDPKAPVVLRMRGYSAFENKNYPQSLQYMNDFFAKVKDPSRIVASDYLYLGKAQLQAKQDSLALINITKAVQLDSTHAEALEEVAKSYFSAKNFAKSAEIYRLAIKANPNGKGSLTNYYYLANANYYNYAYADRDKKNPSKALLVEADSALAFIKKNSPEFTLAYIFTGRIARYEDPENANGKVSAAYEAYIKLVTETKPELSKSAAETKNMVEAYSALGVASMNTDKEKAKDYFNKALAIDPQNVEAQNGLKALAPQPAAKPKGPIKKK